MASMPQALKAILPKSFKAVIKKAIRVIRKSIDSQPGPLRSAILSLWDEIKIARMTTRSAKSLGALRGKKGIKVHLGCASDIKLDWVNIDLSIRVSPGIDLAAHPDTVLIAYDLRRGLPLGEGSCDYIYSSHFFEHLEYRHGVKLMRDCYRALRPGGVFRIVLPSYKRLFDAYLRGDYQYIDLFKHYAGKISEAGTETFVDYVSLAVYEHGRHKCIMDEDKVELLLQKIGYSSVVRSSFQEGIDVDSPIRRRYSFYMQAVK